MRAYATRDGMATLAGDMTAEEAAACYDVIDQLAAMAKADGDPRPIGQIRAGHPLDAHPAGGRSRPARGHGEPGRQRQPSRVWKAPRRAAARSTGSRSPPLTCARLLRRLGTLGLTTPEGGSLTFAITDEHGRLLATVSGRGARTPREEGLPRARGTPTAAALCWACRRRPRAYAAHRRPAAIHPPPATGGAGTPNCGQRAGWADHDHVMPHGEGGRTACTNLCCRAGRITG